MQTASVATFMAINGDGFFAVQKPGTFTDGTPVFDGVDRYTRRGDFQLDKNGYLVNGAGYYLMAFRSTRPPATLGSSPQVLQFQNDFLPAQATTKIDYRANLASYPLTTKHDTSVPGSELLSRDRSAPAITRWCWARPPRPYTDAVDHGHGAEQQGTPSVANTGSAPLLSGAAGTDSICANFPHAGRHHHGQRHRHHLRGRRARAATSSTSPTTSTTLLAKIDVDHRHRDPVHDLRRRRSRCIPAPRPISRRHAARTPTAFAALGFAGTATGDARRRRHDRHRPGDRQRQLDLPQRIRRRRRGHRLRRLGRAGEPAVPLGQDRQRFARRRPHRHLEPVLPGQSQRHRHAGRPGRTSTPDFTFSANGQMSPAIASVTLTNVRRQRRLARQSRRSTSAPAASPSSPMPTATCRSTRSSRTASRPAAAVGRRQRQRPRRRQLFQRPQPRPRRNHRSRPSTAPTSSSASTAARSRRPTNPARRCSATSGKIVGSSLEGSNTDIADEFTKLIVTQQAYSANTKVITTSNRWCRIS